MSEEEQREVRRLVSGGSWRSSSTGEKKKRSGATDLVSVSSEAAALHGAGVEVALVVELEARQARVQLVQDGRQAAPQRQQLGAGAVEADAHGALQRHASSVTQQGAERKAEDRGNVEPGMNSMKQRFHNSIHLSKKGRFRWKLKGTVPVLHTRGGD